MRASRLTRPSMVGVPSMWPSRRQTHLTGTGQPACSHVGLIKCFNYFSIKLVEATEGIPTDLKAPQKAYPLTSKQLYTSALKSGTVYSDQFVHVSVIMRKAAGLLFFSSLASQTSFATWKQTREGVTSFLQAEQACVKPCLKPGFRIVPTGNAGSANMTRTPVVLHATVCC